jgi:polysaccharide biosynthesis transport protein
MSLAPQDQSVPEFRFDFATLLTIGWRKKRWVVFGLIAGIGVGVACGLFLPRVYQSSAQIAILKKRPDSVTGVDTRLLAADDYLAPPQEMLKSSLIIDQAIRAKELASLSFFENQEQDLTEKIRNSLTVTPNKGTPGQSVVFKLSYRGADRDGCQTVLAAILDSFQDFIDKKHNAISADSIELILREKQALQKSLEAKEAAYRVFRETAPLFGTGKDDLELRQERLNSIQTKRSAVLLQRIELEGQVAAVDAATAEGRGQDVVLALLQEFARRNDAAEPGTERPVSSQDQLLPMLQEEQKLQQIYGAKHPEVLAAQNRIEVTRRLLLLPPSSWKSDIQYASVNPEKSLDDAVELRVQLLRQKLHQLKTADELLAKIFRTEQDEARRLSGYEIQNDSFRTSIHFDQQLYEALVKRLNDVSLIKNVGGYQIEMIEPPSLGARIAPSMAITLLVGAFFGILVGFALACWAHTRASRMQGAIAT